MRKTARLIACLSLLAMTATTALAVEGGNPKKGKHLYKKSCKACHTEGGQGPAMTPMSKTQAQWERVFQGEKNADCWKNLSDQEARDIQQFLFNHAADSDQPQTCG